MCDYNEILLQSEIQFRVKNGISYTSLRKSRLFQQRKSFGSVVKINRALYRFLYSKFKT